MMPDEFDEHDDDERARGGILPETLRKALVTGISAVFMTEEGIRGMLSDLRLPKDAIAYVIQQTDKSRRELFRIVAEELKGFLKNADVPGEIRRALSGLKVEIKAEVRFVDESNTQHSVSMRAADDSGADGGSGLGDSDSNPDGDGRAEEQEGGGDMRRPRRRPARRRNGDSDPER